MADNKIIRTTILDIIAYVPSDGYFVIEQATGTYKTKWQTIVSFLSANIPLP
jgi:hypothetical protein